MARPRPSPRHPPPGPRRASHPRRWPDVEPRAAAVRHLHGSAEGRMTYSPERVAHATQKRWGSVSEREHAFWSQVDRSGGAGACWPWGGRTDVGYGRQGATFAHRIAFIYARGPIPEGLDLDHLCRFRLCCNPAHLEPVTRAENVRRQNADTTHPVFCPVGHEYPTFVAGGHRRCRHCQRSRHTIYMRTYRQRAVA